MPRKDASQVRPITLLLTIDEFNILTKLADAEYTTRVNLIRRSIKLWADFEEVGLPKGAFGDKYQGNPKYFGETD